MFGFLNIHKPTGVTSRDVVNRVQRLMKPHKVGHAGTLDPLATGVLIVAVGQATRLIEYVQRMPKRYRGTFLFGRESDTEDVEGNVLELADAPQPSREQVEGVLPQFVGEIEQIPPAYSALKVAGRRAYDLARHGQGFELAARPVSIHALAIEQYNYPELKLTVCCGSGTYIRSLGRDIARALGTQAVMSALVREAIGSFMLNNALPMQDISAESIRDNLLSPIAAVPDLPRVELTSTDIQQLILGRQIANRLDITAAEIAATDERGQLAAILTNAPHDRLRTLLLFARDPYSP